MENILRTEYPNPQWERENWVNLNGIWDFDFDFGMSARDRQLFKPEEKLEKKIVVPFCPESKLSGIHHIGFMNSVVYKRTFEIDSNQLENNVMLCFGAVDYRAFVYINGEYAGTHNGGYTPFKFRINHLVKPGENTVCVIAEDEIKSGNQPAGKQSNVYYSSGCAYTRTTGIWQTVWIEMVPMVHIKSAKYYPDIEKGTLTVIGETYGEGTLIIESSFEGRKTGSCKLESKGGSFVATLALSEIHLWDVGQGNLYDLDFRYGEDKVKSYFGLRNICLDGMKFMLNNRCVFQRLVLDQGFYPDGIYTAPTDADFIKDIRLSVDAGFNGARLHEKVFEPRFLYYCDKMGYLVWGEYANWGMKHENLQATEIFLNEWMEAVERDFNHPAIIGWCPFNETWEYVEHRSGNRLLTTVYKYTKAIDSTRPVIDTSGNYHCTTDIYDVHNYEQDPVVFKECYDRLYLNGELYDQASHDGQDQLYAGGPVFVSEYGGMRWSTDETEGWGYGNAPKTPQEFAERYEGLTKALLDNPKIMGFCYTQLYDIEQEINGLYTYERTPKFDIDIFKKINTQKAAIED